MEANVASKTMIYLNYPKSVSTGEDRIRKNLCLCQLACWPTKS